MSEGAEWCFALLAFVGALRLADFLLTATVGLPQ